ncbi:lysine N(6)-hydroxylase/L-ornithine N(5)-oxygenase family protein [Streptomyces parvulus]|uniref:L-lysine N6-monooxygenase MbtG n=1 Tax=Streptomyces parvulus TaxID=146923 RepID=A0A191VAJ4_9ACTN|nr:MULTISPECIES: lysine N(6)-hydroxylase/L-ornithine N(5)-oxygenase family protein [Streptomyces]ANJ11935.1 L-lysine 6-monooxygenase [Streptomyces parvulus]MCC9158188.1 lysine N(6)-hydroxylase/L-ornithine N(5)-oxygenase family protein [Streptomyces parvulus]MCE7691437.1 lysine N(6)-hydroxylase/L-ornithine N(5)-oxygenase family protein [Streptomyces parvulus]MCQ4196068.1 lysine N(6)-hydroxylase/L-ornithine N(5)-oxygenase family protein [Streptomyces parvulus]MZD59076.1 SidA/IucD/PvdA family mon
MGITGRRNEEILDVVGIGFGPSNLSLAIALEEHGASAPRHPVTSHFFERQPTFGWHRNMLLPSTTMQISFLKDLATFRNPMSRFSFISYLHASDRLVQFVNNQDFFPTRQEFHQYLEWAASGLSDRVTYGAEVTAIRPGSDGNGLSPDLLEVEARTADGTTRVVTARNVAISTGLVPRLPEGVTADERVWHSSQFLSRFNAQSPDDLKSVAVVGAGQSAAEITRFLHDALPHAQVCAVVPSYGYSVADDTPFANQVFDPAAVDDYYFGTDRGRDAFWRYHRNTNYSVVDADVIRDLHQRTYDEEVRGTRRLHFRNLTRVAEVERSGSTTRVVLRSLLDDRTEDLSVDALVFATGYDGLDPVRLLGDFDRHFRRDAAGRHRLERDYRLVPATDLTCGVYLQGGTEHSHGLSSSLLSNIAVRSGEIADSIVLRRTERELERDRPVEVAPPVA